MRPEINPKQTLNKPGLEQTPKSSWHDKPVGGTPALGMYVWYLM